jgi:hypothetical protein
MALRQEGKRKGTKRRWYGQEQSVLSSGYHARSEIIEMHPIALFQQWRRDLLRNEWEFPEEGV